MSKYLIEIKNRFFLVTLTCISTFIVTYIYKESILFLITQSYYNLITKSKDILIPYFIFTEITEIFNIYITLTLFVTFQTIIFYFCYHSFLFFSPALFQKEYFQLKTLTKIIFFTWLLSGILSNYYLIPLTWNFFYSFQELSSFKPIDLYFEAKLIDYIKFYISLYYICFFYFQIFIFLLYFLNRNNIKLNSIQKFRKIYYYIFLILTTIFTPPDIISQLVSAFIFILIYEINLFFFIYKKYLKKQVNLVTN